MKKHLLTLSFVVAALVGLSAQKGAVKVNPLGLLFGNLNAGYEHVLSDKSSIEGGISYSSFDASFNGDADAKFTGIGAYVMYRAYLGKSKVAPRGIYLAPRIGYNSTSSTVDDVKGSVSLFSAGALFGHQWVWPKDGDSGFLLDLALGAAYYNASADENISNIGLDGIGPAFRLAIGYAF